MDRAHTHGAEFRLYYSLEAGRTGLQKFWHGSRQTVEAAFDAYVCSQCGYTEWYTAPEVVNEALGLAAQAPNSGVRLLDRSQSG